MTHQHFSRRDFLRSIASATGVAAAPLALNLAAAGTAAAAGASDYKALICLYMMGGNDHYNTFLATDRTSWTEYERLRDTNDAQSIALPKDGSFGGVLPVGTATVQPGRTFAFHPQLAGLRQLYNSGRAAVVSNVGTLVQPTTREQYLANSVPLPPKLFSHNDQQAVWLSDRAEGSTVGWGGRMADLINSANGNSSFTCISAAGNTVFLSGRQMQQFQIAPAGAVPIEGISGRVLGANFQLRSLIAGSHTNKLEAAHASVVSRSIDLQAQLASAMVAAGPGGVPNPKGYVNPMTGTAAVNPLASQLQIVARMIAAREALGMKRQVFFVSMGGFDTHDGQSRRHAALMARLDHALSYFDTTMANLMGANVRQQVTLFTASDFGRTLTSNGDGTDHGWGSHHFVAGGAVRGSDIYGDFPTIGLGHANDIGQGALLPSVAVDQYGATLGRWLGLSDSELIDVFPSLVNFSQRDLGFMR
ncbi:DUF1501 domain-containing protein [Pseudoduganella lutea]|uniref:DUF1501 domain-containing protein n=1 Tax=Pseudoduganella lutea TaxID=321985 RepID=A0A4P6KUB6_9BURK|nr:DUF1501 domain-containing protein [Pseudoduganella lutea]QBE62520.1 DUF1501 domain-containing protein [Pseudoduganella lutea]